MSILEIPTPRAFVPLLGRHRYKGAKGGRGSGKSHFFAEMLVEEAVAGHVRAACLREVQNSIKDSVKQLIEDKIAALGVAHLFKSTETETRGPNDSLFIYRGLQNHTVTSIKSLEGFNRAWVEEAQTVSQKSLDIATPTFRAPGSQMWFSWNPVSAADPVERFFNDNAGDPDFVCVRANWSDNPWFPDELRADMDRDRKRDPGKYAHVWGGEYQALGEAAVFRNWSVEEFEPPADAIFRFGADWGFSVDPTVLVRAFIVGRTLYVDREAWQVGCEIDHTPALFDQIEGSRQWTIRADSSRPETVSYMQRKGFKIIPAIKGTGSVEDGIEFLKSYDIVVHPRCKRTIEELTHYRFKTDPQTGEILPVLEDKDNHVIDALRYACEGLRRAARPSKDVPSRDPPDLWGRKKEPENRWKVA
ncbi:MAG: PBSX family phage terminase large subunit [Pseudomonadota bacterium]